MFLNAFEVTPDTLVSEIVARDYRTADIFNKYGIEYCCGGKWPLKIACLIKGLELELIMIEIQTVTRIFQLPNNLPFNEWKIDFLVDYIINIHHHFLKQTLPALKMALDDFATEHEKKYPHFQAVLLHYQKLEKEILPHLKQEEEVIFPYLRQVAHAYERKDSFATLLVKTLRKPIASVMDHEHRILNEIIYLFRKLTNNYISPENACTNHKVILSKLKALDNDLVQHIFLENEILFPRVITMEKELLANKS